MSNWRAGGTSAYDVTSRQWRMRFKPPMTSRRALEKSTSGTDNYYFSYVREEWTPLSIGVNQAAVEPMHALYRSGAAHILDVGFRLDAGYEVIFQVPREQQGVFTLTISCLVTTRVWVNIAVVQDRDDISRTPAASYIFYQGLVYYGEPLILPNIAMGPGAEIRAAASADTDYMVTGPLGSTT